MSVKDNDCILFLLHKKEGVFYGREMCEEIKNLKEGQHIWNREARGKMSRNKIREVEGSQIMHRMVSHIEILILIPRTV